METGSIKSVYLLGIGGIGMSALARFFHGAGAAVSGYDKTPTPLTDDLIGEGMEIHFEEDPGLVPENPDLVIYTPAIPADHAELLFIRNKGYQLKKRAEVLGMITYGTRTVAVAGTHGKTTTSTLIAHILKVAGIPFTAFLGGISKNYGTNYLAQDAAPDFYVVEADEYDRSFLQLSPYAAVITSADADHLDIYRTLSALHQSFEAFTARIETGGRLVLKRDVSIRPQLQHDVTLVSYSTGGPSDYFARNIRKGEGRFQFDLVYGDQNVNDIRPGLPGTFNLENAIAASAVAHFLGVNGEVLRKALESYTGVRRRFDVQIRRDDFVYIDDYAHHPEELNACISAVKEICPGKKVTGVFQPHLYTRTRDLASAFARSLELLDEVILLDIYPAREKPIEGVTSSLILDQIVHSGKRLCSRGELPALLARIKPEVLLTLGAGDIDQLVEPIRLQFSTPSESL